MRCRKNENDQKTTMSKERKRLNNHYEQRMKTIQKPQIAKTKNDHKTTMSKERKRSKNHYEQRMKTIQKPHRRYKKDKNRNFSLLSIHLFCVQHFLKQELMVVNAILEKAKHKPKGVRYDPAFLLECVLLRIKSKAAYLHLKENKILPLPDPSTIRKLLSCMPCTFGFNGFALDAIRRNLEKLPKSFRLGSFCWDEFAIQEDCSFDSKKMEIDGFVDYGDAGLTIRDKHCGQLADHAMVFIFRPYRFGWIQPFACFATKGACPADLLYELMARAITALELHDAIVSSVVCDGAQSNKSVMQMCGVDGRFDKLVNTFVNRPNSATSTTEDNVPTPAAEQISTFEHGDSVTCASSEITSVSVPDVCTLPAGSTQKRKRGRPAKSSTPNPTASPLIESCPAVKEPAPKKKRGRPPKSTKDSKKAIPSIAKKTIPLSLLTTNSDEKENSQETTTTISAKTAETASTSFDHPTVEAAFIYFFVDVPHIIKCIRNHIFKKKYVQVIHIILARVTKCDVNYESSLFSFEASGSSFLILNYSIKPVKFLVHH